MIRLLCAFLIACTTLTANAKSILRDVKSYRQNGSFYVDLSFDSFINASDVNTNFINETVQVDIPNGFLPQGTKTNEVNNENVKSVFTYQVGKNTLRTRLILKKNTPATTYRNNMNITAQGNILRIKLDEPKSKLVSKAAMLDAVPVLPPSLRSEVAKDLKEEAMPEEVNLPNETKETPAVATTTSAAEITDRKDTPVASESAPSVTVQTEESKIPVLTKSKPKASTLGNPFVKLAVALTGILAFALVMGVVAKQWTRVAKKNLKNSQIKVITQHYLAPKKSLAIIRVAGESILVGITDHAITPIKTLSLLDEELPEELPASFSNSMRVLEEREPAAYALPAAKPDKVEIANSTARGIRAYGKPQVSEQNENYSIRGIKDLVKEKLKDMRTI